MMNGEKKTYKCSEVKKSCYYSVTLEPRMTFCDYICKTGHRRECDPEECDKYKPRE